MRVLIIRKPRRSGQAGPRVHLQDFGMHEFDIAILACIVALAVHRVWDSRILTGFIRSVTVCGDMRDAALAMAAACYRIPDHGPDPSFVPFMPFIGASPGAVLERGGCCSGRSRLLILALARLGIPAFQITLYHANGNAQHCLVQAWIGADPLILDPSYGVSYAGRDGRPIGLADLQDGQVPRLVSLPGVESDGYPRNSYYDFNYADTRTANWTASAARRVAYRTIRALIGQRADKLEVPELLEWPQYLAIAGLVSVLLTVHLLTA